VPNFAVIAAPLTDATKKGNPHKIPWGSRWFVSHACKRPCTCLLCGRMVQAHILSELYPSVQRLCPVYNIHVIDLIHGILIFLVVGPETDGRTDGRTAPQSKILLDQHQSCDASSTESCEKTKDHRTLLFTYLLIYLLTTILHMIYVYDLRRELFWRIVNYSSDTAPALKGRQGHSSPF